MLLFHAVRDRVSGIVPQPDRELYATYTAYLVIVSYQAFLFKKNSLYINFFRERYREKVIFVFRADPQQRTDGYRLSNSLFDKLVLLFS